MNNSRAPRRGSRMSLALLSATAAIAQSAAINGEVKKIDESAGKITLKHGPAKSLGMDEPMTMVYRVKDPAMLKQVKVGDKVQFEAEEAASGYHRDEAAEEQVGEGPAAMP